MVKTVITAPRGTMDSLIIQEAFRNENMEITGVVGTPGRRYIGQDAGLVCGLGQEIGVKVCDDIEKVIEGCDIVIDFSRVEVSMAILQSCLNHRKGFICGTTGFNEEQTEQLLAAGEKIPMKAKGSEYRVNIAFRNEGTFTVKVTASGDSLRTGSIETGTCRITVQEAVAAPEEKTETEERVETETETETETEAATERATEKKAKPAPQAVTPPPAPRPPKQSPPWYTDTMTLVMIGAAVLVVLLLIFVIRRRSRKG